MAKLKKPKIDWNGLTVAEINGIVQHFEDAERYYIQQTQQAHALGNVSVFEPSIPRVQSRQRFWKEMVAYVERGEKISPHVREYMNYCRNTMEFSR
jgi:hypothetical protein